MLLKKINTVLRQTLFVTVSFAEVTAGIVGAELTEVVEGSNVVKLNVGKDDVLMGSEMLGRTGTSTTLGEK